MARKKKPSHHTLTKGITFWLIVLSLFVASMCAFFYFIFLRPGTFSNPPSAPAGQYTDDAAPLLDEGTAPLPLLRPGPIKIRPAPPAKPRIAIVIDDMGYHNAVASQLLSLDFKLSFAILPHGPHSASHMKRAAQQGHDILLHLPMEPRDSKWDPGKGALLTSMDDKQIATTLTENLSAIPFAIGVNNHMGSRFTELTPGVTVCLQELHKKNLFFLDSLTTHDSKAFQTAKKMGMKTAKRDIFLDNVQTAEAIGKQLDSLVQIAQKTGSAIAIGHPYQATFNALQAYQPILNNEVELVGVSDLMD